MRSRYAKHCTAVLSYRTAVLVTLCEKMMSRNRELGMFANIKSSILLSFLLLMFLKQRILMFF